MIEIITEPVEMPKKKRFEKNFENNRWSVVDTETGLTRYKGKFEDVCIAWHNLNKKYYRDIALAK